MNAKSLLFYFLLTLFAAGAYLYKQNLLPSLPVPPSQQTAKKQSIQLPFKEKQYYLNFPEDYRDSVTEIAGFERKERWTGQTILSDVNLEGETRFSLFSSNDTPTKTSLIKSLDLSNRDNIRILIFLPKEDYSKKIKHLTLRLGARDDTSYFEFDISGLKAGWNILVMPMNQFSRNGVGHTSTTESVNTEADERVIDTESGLWSRIGKISIELTARPNSNVELYLDRLWAESDEDYADVFLASRRENLSLKEHENKVYLNSLNFGNNTLELIKKVTSVKNFTYTVKFIPQKEGSFGIGGRIDNSTSYGYYIEFNGINQNSWRLYKIGQPENGSGTTRLDSGVITNFSAAKNEPVWLQMRTSGSKISAYISTDGKNFTRLSEKDDGEHRSGGIGFQTDTSVLIESIVLQQ